MREWWNTPAVAFGFLVVGIGAGAVLTYISPKIGIPVGGVLIIIGILLIIRAYVKGRGHSHKTHKPNKIKPYLTKIPVILKDMIGSLEILRINAESNLPKVNESILDEIATVIMDGCNLNSSRDEDVRKRLGIFNDAMDAKGIGLANLKISDPHWSVLEKSLAEQKLNIRDDKLQSYIYYFQTLLSKIIRFLAFGRVFRI